MLAARTRRTRHLQGDQIHLPRRSPDEPVPEPKRGMMILRKLKARNKLLEAENETLRASLHAAHGWVEQYKTWLAAKQNELESAQRARNRPRDAAAGGKNALPKAPTANTNGTPHAQMNEKKMNEAQMNEAQMNEAQMNEALRAEINGISKDHRHPGGRRGSCVARWPAWLHSRLVGSHVGPER